MTPSTIAVGFDGSPDSKAALRWALELAATTNANVVVVHAAGLLEHAGQVLSRSVTPDLVVSLAESSGLDTTRVQWLVDDGDPCSVLLRTCGEPLQANMLVVGSRGHGRHPGLLLGSTSLQLAERATVPVVIVPVALDEDADPATPPGHEC